MWAHKQWFSVLGTAGVICAAGCNGAQSRLVPVEGRVTLDGQPMAGVQVFFDQPQEATGKSFIGKTNDQGRFALRPLGEEAVGGQGGAFRVTLTTSVAEVGAPDEAPLPPERIPPAYRNGKLQYEVPPAGTHEANFDLKGR
jgi:hypothetical protein